MKVTAYTRATLRIRRERRRLFALGYEEVGDNGGMLWEIHRGGRMGQRITDAVVGPDGLSVFVKIEPKPRDNPALLGAHLLWLAAAGALPSGVR